MLHKGYTPEEIVTDRGYKGRPEVKGVTIITPYDIKEGLLQKIIRRLTQLLRRRASIEPIIGHIKSDHRMGKNLLKGILGGTINPLFAAADFDLLKYTRIEYARLHKHPKSLIHYMS